MLVIIIFIICQIIRRQIRFYREKTMKKDKTGLKIIRGINRQGEMLLNGCLITSLKDLVSCIGRETRLKNAMRQQFPNDNLPSVETLQNWCQQAYLLKEEENDLQKT